jgi:hypothetical protein
MQVARVDSAPALVLSLAARSRGAFNAPALLVTKAEGAAGRLFEFCQLHACAPRQFEALLGALQASDVLQPERLLRRAGLAAFTDKAHTHAYERFYARYLSPLRARPVRLLEVGFAMGQSSLLWCSYFPLAQRAVFLDLMARQPGPTAVPSADAEGSPCLPGTHVLYQADQALPQDLLRVLRAEASVSPERFDVVLDDGGHEPYQQLVSFITLFARALKPGGVYIIEDIEMSYWQPYAVLFREPADGSGVPGSASAGGAPPPRPPHPSRTRYTRNAVEEFKRAVDVVNRGFHDQGYHALHPSAREVESVFFGENCIILTKVGHSRRLPKCVTSHARSTRGGELRHVLQGTATACSSALPLPIHHPPLTACVPLPCHRTKVDAAGRTRRRAPYRYKHRVQGYAPPPAGFGDEPAEAAHSEGLHVGPLLPSETDIAPPSVRPVLERETEGGAGRTRAQGRTEGGVAPPRAGEGAVVAGGGGAGGGSVSIPARPPAEQEQEL